ncbi:hypothetical protein CYMTET_15837 [Cymbomonas tetramitiformis]|uniref:Uncharacterized protein n=1 Tax=Cymbomonas tetramitiformis TaxID=36881 RepID=A0AAE0GD73_9CHLO|nr:hypothetical protein CYMTET_15837 [Cymbomonas tetramitiformis]
MVAGEHTDPSSDSAVMTFIAPLTDPPPPLDHASADSDAAAEPAVKPHPADMVLHLANGDFTWESEPVAMHAFADDGEDWPAFRTTPWIPPPTIDTSADRQSAAGHA